MTAPWAGMVAVAVPMSVEWWALGPVDGGRVVGVGRGPARARRVAARLFPPDGGPRPAALAVVGVAGALAAGPEPGDVVVADEVRDGDGSVSRPVAQAVVAALREQGLTVHVGAIHTADHPVDAAERDELARTGALAVDTESAPLVRAAGETPWVVLRAINGTPDRPLRALSTVAGGIAALRTLRKVKPALEKWEVG